MILPLTIIGHIPIPAAVRKHRFFAEAQANALLLEEKRDPRTQVIGTFNTQACELYGWAPNVTPHFDRIGWMYAVLLDEGVSYVHARPRRGATAGPHLSVRLEAGDVFRLDDFCEHWTEDVKPRVAAFVGTFELPCDALAMRRLRRGIVELEAGSYYGAPRVRDGFRAILPDECYVANVDWSDAELMLEADVAPARRDAILQCAKCTNKAVRLDQFWPYQMDLNRCRAHLCSGGAERNARGDSLPKAGESAGPADKDPMGEAARFEPEGLAGDAWAALPPAANDDCQSRPSQARAHEAPKPCLAGEGAPS